MADQKPADYPIGTTAVAAFDANVSFLDVALTDRTKEKENDRKGVSRYTYHGIELRAERLFSGITQQFQVFLESSGYSGGERPYAAGITLSSHNQGFVKCDSNGQACLFYTPNSDTPLPYTTTGDWANESALFVVRGDQSLRQDLNSEDGGANIINFSRTPIATTIQSLAFFLQGTEFSLWEFAHLADQSAGPNKKDWDWTAALQGAFDAVPDGGTLFVPYEEYKITGNPTLLDKNINIVCQGVFVLARDEGAYITMKRGVSHTISGSQLIHLPSKGDMFLYPSSPPVTDAQNFIVALKSSEAEITRIGDPTYTPYTKNEANELVSSGFRLRAPIKLNYTQPASLSISMYKKGIPVRVSGLRIRISDEGPAVTRKPRALVVQGMSNMSFDHCDIDRTNSNIPGINIWMEECALLSWETSFVRGFNSSSGDAYAWLGEISAFIEMHQCGFVDGSGTKEERGWAGRHCSHVLIDNCRFSGVDDHYGHNYIVQNMTMSRGVGISGGSLTVRNITHRSEAWALVTLRGDSPYADGDLIIEDCSTNFCLLWSVRDEDSRSTKRKTWDRIRIEGNYVEGRAARGAITVRINKDTDEFEATLSMRVNKNDWVRSNAGSECFFFHGSNPGEDGANRKLWVSTVYFVDNTFRNGYPDSYTSVIDHLKTDRLICRGNTEIMFTALSAWNSTFDGDSIGIEGGAPFSFSDIAGWRIFRGVTLNPSLGAFSGGNGNTTFTAGFFMANPFSDSAFSSTVRGLSANVASVDMTGAPGDIWDFKV